MTTLPPLGRARSTPTCIAAQRQPYLRGGFATLLSGLLLAGLVATTTPSGVCLAQESATEPLRDPHAELISRYQRVPRRDSGPAAPVVATQRSTPAAPIAPVTGSGVRTATPIPAQTQIRQVSQVAPVVGDVDDLVFDMAPEEYLGEPAGGYPVDGPVQSWLSHVLPHWHVGGRDNCCAPAVARHWVEGEFLLAYIEGVSTPALVTTSPDGTPRINAGVLGLPTTTVLYGNDKLLDGFRPGFRGTAGTWLGGGEFIGIEGVYTYWGQDSATYTNASTGSPILARPFFNVEPGLEGQASELVAYPGELEGNITVQTDTQLQAIEVLLRHRAGALGPNYFDLVAGWRYNRLQDSISISDFKRVVGNGLGLAVGTTLSETDVFASNNQFHGAQVGALAGMRHCNWNLELGMKIAIGNNYSRVRISGTNTSTVPIPGGAPVSTTSGHGLLALPSNIGFYRDNQLAVVPELGAKLGFQITPGLRASVGYTFMYWSRVLRAGEQIDPNLNLSQIAPGGLNGLAYPIYPARTTDLWAQAVTAGIEARF